MEQERYVFMGSASRPHPAPLRGVELWRQLRLLSLSIGSPVQRPGVDLARAEVVSRGRAGREGCSRPFPSGQLILALLGPLQDAQGRKEAQTGDWGDRSQC